MSELLPWQRSQWERLLYSKTAGRLPHALLCTGSAGLGKRLFAERLAAALLCAAPGADGAPCGGCRGCTLFAAGSHPDAVRVEPAEAGKPIRVDQVRELCAFLGFTTRFGGYKIALVAPAERMNVNAANSLLKTLEEPPPRSLLLLVSDAPFRLPATVRSRCQRVVFARPETPQAIAWLAGRMDGNADPGLLLSLAGGAPLAALAGAPGLARRQALFQGYCEVLAGQSDPVRAAERWVEEDLAQALRWLIGWHMDMIALKMSGEPPRLFNPDLQPGLQRLARDVAARTLFRRLDAALRMLELSATQVNPQLMLEAFLADCAAGAARGG